MRNIEKMNTNRKQKEEVNVYKGERSRKYNKHKRNNRHKRHQN